MDLKQRKLNKSEWESIEVPVAADEMEVLQLIMKGFHNVNIKYNKAESLFSYLKMEVTKEMEEYLFTKYFLDRVESIIKKYSVLFLDIRVNANPQIKKADMIRLQKNTVESLQKANVYEYILLDVFEKAIKCKKIEDMKWMMYYYTLYKMIRNHVSHMNVHIVDIVNKLLTEWEEEINMSVIIKNAVEFIEKNDYLLKYSDMLLYEHQKEIFTVSKNPSAKLVLYIAPTGTGKTMTPIGLSEQHRVIFVCAARHVGLALARAAISVNKKVAFAFGCGSSAEIRLHYFAAKEITRNRRTGGIWKVDNTVGDKVEIMICDIKSYLPAMYYMLAFNTETEIITYWDEPTITMDYEEHEFHEIIQKNWMENKIPNMVLSSATLPKLYELGETVGDFKAKFHDTTICNIVSHDCRKSIPIVNKSGFVVLPHYLFKDHEKTQAVVNHCQSNLTLLRYFDLAELVEFIDYLQNHGLVNRVNTMERYFESLDDVNVIQIKLYYLKLLADISQESWTHVYAFFAEKRKRYIVANDYIDAKGNKMAKSASIGPGVTLQQNNNFGGKPLMRLASEQVPKAPPTPLHATQFTPDTQCAIYITTKDAFTLTDGPTIFLATEVEKVAKFCIQQANIPAKVMEDIVEKINFNNTINDKIAELEKSVEDINEKREKDGKNATNDSGDKKKKLHKLERGYDENLAGNKDMKRLVGEIEMLRAMIKVTKLNEAFIPNTNTHLKKWAEEFKTPTAFRSDIDDETIVKIMLLKNVADSWKVLLLMGIGVFTNHESIEYTEIMKNMADQQKLYLIIASSDYIYGTNYQFCHGYISKDATMTQEKIIQSMGRIGRNKIQQNYTIRFRDDEQIAKIFTNEVEKPEVRNMNRLFSTKVE
jgi:hypothetical protein